MGASQIIVSAVVLLVVISFDVMALGFAHGTSGTRVPLLRLFFISLIGSLMLGASLAVGHLLGEVVSESVITWTAFGLFMGVGFFKFASWCLTPPSREPVEPRTISLWGCMVLALMLSLDGMGVGLAVGIGEVTWLFIGIIVAASMFTEILLFRLGHLLGRRLRERSCTDIGWLPGIVLMTLAAVGLFI